MDHVEFRFEGLTPVMSGVVAPLRTPAHGLNYFRLPITGRSDLAACPELLLTIHAPLA